MSLGGCLRDDMVMNSQGYFRTTAAAIAKSKRHRHNADYMVCRCFCGIRMCVIGRCEARWVFRIHRCQRSCARRLASKSATADEYTFCHTFCRLVSVNECVRSDERPYNKSCASLTIYCTTCTICRLHAANVVGLLSLLGK